MVAVGQARQLDMFWMGDFTLQGFDGGDQFLAVAALKRDRFGAVRQDNGMVPVAVFSRVFFQHGVKISATETKGTDAAAARRIRRAPEPGTWLGVDVEGCIIAIHPGIGFIHPDGGWQNFLVQRIGALDQPCHAGGDLGVADHRFDGTQGTVADFLVVLAECAGQRLGFRDVARRRAGAVSLDQPYCLRRDAGIFIGALDRQHLAVRVWCCQAPVAAITGCADSLDNAIDPVTIAFGILQALDDDRRHAFRNCNPVCVSRKGFTVATRGQCLYLGECHERGGVVGAVRGPDQGHVRGACAEFLDADIEGGE